MAKIRVGITMGDPSGIGPEVVFKSLSGQKSRAEFVVIGDKWVFEKTRGQRPEIKGYRFVDLGNINRKNFKCGKIRPEYGRASVEYLDAAVDMICSKEIDCLVTAPVSKEAINLSGMHFSGHTEYLKEKSGSKYIVMMLLNEKLKFSLITRHIALKDVASNIKSSDLIKTALLTNEALKGFFSIDSPRIAVCGLNPHASDNGLFGNEENSLLKPAVKKLKKNIKYIYGPLPADSAIKDAFCGRFDCVIALFHDQALIPLKLSSPSGGVNLTLGLPYVRTSPLHGTAFNIAGKNIADPVSMIEAIKSAIRCTSNQKKA
ncbi:MAG: 4-hydroxythreonine-4-phosphate dehydrogenase PdxA [Candidatus Omnitrophica bacterium]|nr:4-hydroxythreonine-4-phosphate dehydrogenase PdxA [Candidatus Omnitrophota bacterium]